MVFFYENDDIYTLPLGVVIVDPLLGLYVPEIHP